MFLGNNGIDESMEEIVVTGRREDEPNFNVRDAILFGSSGVQDNYAFDRDLKNSNIFENDAGYDEAYNYAQEMQNLNPKVSYKGQGMDNFVKGAKKMGTDIYNTAARVSKGIGAIPIAGVAYQNAIAKSNPGMFLAGKTFAPNVMSDFGFAEGGEVDETRPRIGERAPYFRVPDYKTGEYDDIRLGRLRNVFTRLLREPTDDDTTGKKLALAAAEVGLSPVKVVDMFVEFASGASFVDNVNMLMDRPERVFPDSPAVNNFEEFSRDEFRQYRPNDEGPRPSFIPGFQDGGSVPSMEDKSAQFQIDRVMMAVNRLMEMGVSEEEARAVVQRHLELGPYPEQVPSEGGPDEFMRRQRERRKSDPSRPQTLPGPNPFIKRPSRLQTLPSQNPFPETQEEKIRRMDQELIRMLNEDDAAMSEMFDDINERTESESIPDRDVYGEGSDTTYGDDTFARQLYEMEQRKKMQEILDSLEPGEGLAHGGAVRPRGYNMGGAVMPQPQKPQGIATMMTDPRTNMGNMPNQQQQQLSALQTTANAANLNANNLQKSMQAQQQQAMRGGVTAPISQVRIPSTKRRQFEDTLLNSRRRGQKAGQIAQRRASIPATIFG